MSSVISYGYNKKRDEDYARKVVDKLVEVAKVRGEITYSELADTIGLDNPRKLNKILCIVGEKLEELSNLLKMWIPPIQALVVNKNSGIPGDGVSRFIDGYDRYRDKDKRRIIKAMQDRIYEFDKWDDIKVSAFRTWLS